jgi:hypothetical protein
MHPATFMPQMVGFPGITFQHPSQTDSTNPFKNDLAISNASLQLQGMQRHDVYQGFHTFGHPQISGPAPPMIYPGQANVLAGSGLNPPPSLNSLLCGWSSHMQGNPAASAGSVGTSVAHRAPAATPIQELRNIDPEMDRARDEALKTAEQDRARLRREQRHRWVCGDVLSLPELAESPLLRSVRACPSFRAICRIEVDYEEPPGPPAGAAAGTAGARPAKRPAARRSSGEKGVLEVKQKLAGLLELEADARKWYGTLAGPYFEELGRRVAHEFRRAPPASGPPPPAPPLHQARTPLHQARPPFALPTHSEGLLAAV